MIPVSDDEYDKFINPIRSEIRCKKARVARTKWRVQSAISKELYPLGGGNKFAAFDAIKLQVWY